MAISSERLSIKFSSDCIIWDEVAKFYVQYFSEGFGSGIVPRLNEPLYLIIIKVSLSKKLCFY